MNRIIWTTPALNAYSDVLMYLMKASEKEAEKLAEKVSVLTKQLEYFTNSCPVSKRNKGYRRCVITKIHSLVYRVRRSTIYILSFIDNRSNLA